MKKRPLKVGFLLPTLEMQLGGATARWPEMLAIARHVEAAGFDSLWVNDHLLFDLVGERRGQWECWTLLSALAATTTRVELGTLVCCTGFHNPAVLAKQADTIDGISNGRLILGLGAGYHEPEFKGFGLPFDHLVSRFEDAINIIHPLLRTGSVDYTGRFHEAHCALLPRLSPRSGPPIMMGPRPGSARMMRLMARFADYSTRFRLNTVEQLIPDREAMDVICRDAGRDPASLRRTLALFLDLPGHPTDPNGDWAQRARIFYGPPVQGESVDHVVDMIRGFASAGIEHIQLGTNPGTLAGVDILATVLERLDQG